MHLIRQNIAGYMHEYTGYQAVHYDDWSPSVEETLFLSSSPARFTMESRNSARLVGLIRWTRWMPETCSNVIFGNEREE